MRLHVETRGEGPERVVLLHGAPTTPSHLRPLAEHLADAWTTHVVHLPGYGTSAPLVPYDLDHAHAILEDTLLELGIADAHFVGQSSGAYRAFALAARGEVNVLSVAALGATVNLEPDELATLRRQAKMLREGVDPVSIFLDLMLSPKGRTNEFAVADVRGWATASAPEHLAQELEAFAGAVDLRPAIARLRIPMLFRVGLLDLATPPGQSRRVHALAKYSILEEVPDAGHALLAEDFAATALSVRAHLERPQAPMSSGPRSR